MLAVSRPETTPLRTGFPTIRKGKGDRGKRGQPPCPSPLREPCLPRHRGALSAVKQNPSPAPRLSQPIAYTPAFAAPTAHPCPSFDVRCWALDVYPPEPRRRRVGRSVPPLRTRPPRANFMPFMLFTVNSLSAPRCGCQGLFDRESPNSSASSLVASGDFGPFRGLRTVKERLLNPSASICVIPGRLWRLRMKNRIPPPPSHPETPTPPPPGLLQPIAYSPAFAGPATLPSPTHIPLLDSTRYLRPATAGKPLASRLRPLPPRHPPGPSVPVLTADG